MVRAFFSWATFVGFLIISVPMIAVLWIFLISTVNWHDVLLVSIPIVVQYQIHIARRKDNAAERAVRRIRAKESLKKWERGQGLHHDEATAA